MLVTWARILLDLLAPTDTLLKISKLQGVKNNIKICINYE